MALGMVTGMIANHFLETGDLDSAMHYIKESFKIHEELGNKSQILQNISFMAGLDLQREILNLQWVIWISLWILQKKLRMI